MKEQKICAVPSCPAFVNGRGKVCDIHRNARFAKDIPTSLLGSCRACKRKITREDWIESEPETSKNRKGELRTLYRHVNCEPVKPVMTARRRREAEKPLFGDLTG